jgi:hypothetical protein
MLPLRSQFGKIIFKTGNDEKDISAITQKKSEQAWLQGKDVDSKWQKSSVSTQGKGKKEAYCYIRTQIEIISQAIII